MSSRADAPASAAGVGRPLQLRAAVIEHSDVDGQGGEPSKTEKLTTVTAAAARGVARGRRECGILTLTHLSFQGLPTRSKHTGTKGRVPYHSDTSMFRSVATLNTTLGTRSTDSSSLQRHSTGPERSQARSRGSRRT